MKPMLPMLTALFVAAACAAETPDACLHALGAAGDVVFAAGDAGTVLRSGDAGQTWRRLAPDELRGASIRAVRHHDGRFYFLGGRAIPGLPSGQARGAGASCNARGEAWELLPLGEAGMLYGGAFLGPGGVVFGQATIAAPGGIRRSVTGKLYRPLKQRTGGHLLGAAWRDANWAYLVGSDHRILSLRRMKEPTIHPPDVASRRTLRAAALAGDADRETCYAVGDAATVTASRPDAKPWVTLEAPIPRRVRRMADFSIVETAPPNRIWVGGGLLGVVLFSTDGGSTWDLRNAPGPGPLRAMVHLRGNTLLAAGDAGRLWRSGDAGKNWRRVAGPERTDLLTIGGAADRDLFPAAVLDAAAGACVAMLSATTPEDPRYPAAQPLELAAATGGFGGAWVLRGFRSLAVAGRGDFTQADCLAAWSAALDVSAEPELLRQLTAAIRLYRPRVIAVAEDSPGARGADSENRLVARLAIRAAERAADETAYPELAKLGLAPWTTQRVCTRTHASPAMPGGEDERPDAAEKMLRTRVVPAGDAEAVELTVQRALAALPWTGALDRAAPRTIFRCGGRVAGETLTGRRLDRARAQEDRDLLSGLALRPVSTRGKLSRALAPLAAAARKREDALAADRLLLLWGALLDGGELTAARQARDVFLRHGQTHPMFRRINVMALAETGSVEWRTHAAALGPNQSISTAQLPAALKVLRDWDPWTDWAPGRLLLGRLLGVTGQGPAGLEQLSALTRAPYALDWRRFAAGELALLTGRGRQRDARTTLAPTLVTERGKLDGRLDEPCWAKAKVHALESADRGAPGATLRAVRTPGAVLLGVELADAQARRWDLELWVDADRDGWTARSYRCNTLGERSAALGVRGGAAMPVARRKPTGRGLLGPQRSRTDHPFYVQARRGDRAWTFEISLPLPQLGAEPRGAHAWLVQLRALARDAEGHHVLWLGPQEAFAPATTRAAVLLIPAAVPKTAD